MREKRVLIFRHGETDWNLEGRFQGHIDIPLNSTGRLQAKGLITVLRSKGIEAILSSDLSRAYETARIVANSLGVPVYVDSKLREANLGGAQGLLKEEIEARFGLELAHRWRSSLPTDADISYPGGESGGAIMERVFSGMEAFLCRADYQQIGVSVHGGVIRRVMEKLLPPGSPMVPIPNGVLYELSFDTKEKRWISI